MEIMQPAKKPLRKYIPKPRIPFRQTVGDNIKVHILKVDCHPCTQ